MTRNYQIMKHEYYKVADDFMVHITDVYNRQLKRMQYVIVDEDSLIISDYDAIRNTIPNDCDVEEFVQHHVHVRNLTHFPTPDNDQMMSITEDVAELLFDCYLLFIRAYCKHTGDNYVCNVDALPNELYDLVTKEYSIWLADNRLDPATNGYSIIVHPEYNSQLIIEQNFSNNGKEAKKLQLALNGWFPADSEDKNQEAWDRFYNEKIYILVRNCVYTFENAADIYNGLCTLVNTVIDEQ